MKKALLILMVLICLCIFSGCGEKEERPEGHFAVMIENKTEIFIASILVFGEADYEWGKEMLAQTEAIAPGDSHTVYLPAGENFLYPISYEEYVMGSYQINSEDVTVVVGFEGAIPVLVVNNSSHDLGTVLISPSDTVDWGENLLPPYSIIVSEIGRRFFYLEPGVYDFEAWDVEGNLVVQDWEIDVSAMRTFIIPED